MALSAEQNRDRLLDLILTEAQHLCNADGGTLYLRTEDDHLAFEILKNDSLKIEIGGVSGEAVPFAPLRLFDSSGRPNRGNVATVAVHEKRLIHIPDAYDSKHFDFAGTKAFDQKSGYRSKSFLTVPLINGEGMVIGVIQLLNAQDEHGNVIPFADEHQEIVAALSSQAAIALDNKLLMEAQKNLLESFIMMIAAAIDAKSPYTGGHCERVPVIAEMLMDEVCRANEGPFSGFSMSEDERYELHIAAWLHDCGKVTTPVHVMDKATKLETITDRIETVRARFEILKRDAKIAYLEEIVGGAERASAKERYDAQLRLLSEDLEFVERANVGGEFLPPEAQARISQIGELRYQAGEKSRRLLDDEEVKNLSISRGTLTEEERLIINGHMVQTARMLDALPFPRNLRRVPEYASGHHETMDGRGYPRGIFAGDMSIPARAMAIADVFEALTATDRPYKKGKTLSESMRIMGFMKKDNHLDPELFDLFVTSGVYKKYAEKYLSPSLIDEVDEAALLAMQPKGYSLPPEEERRRRKSAFLPIYEEKFPAQSADHPLGIAPLLSPSSPAHKVPSS